MQHDCDNPPRGSTLSRLGATYRNEGVDEVDGTTPAKTSKPSEDEEEPSSRKCTARFNLPNLTGRLDGGAFFHVVVFFVAEGVRRDADYRQHQGRGPQGAKTPARTWDEEEAAAVAAEEWELQQDSQVVRTWNYDEGDAAMD